MLIAWKNRAFQGLCQRESSVLTQQCSLFINICFVSWLRALALHWTSQPGCRGVLRLAASSWGAPLPLSARAPYASTSCGGKGSVCLSSPLLFSPGCSACRLRCFFAYCAWSVQKENQAWKEVALQLFSAVSAGPAGAAQEEHLAILNLCCVLVQFHCRNLVAFQYINTQPFAFNWLTTCTYWTSQWLGHCWLGLTQTELADWQ